MTISKKNKFKIIMPLLVAGSFFLGNYLSKYYTFSPRIEKSENSSSSVIKLFGNEANMSLYYKVSKLLEEKHINSDKVSQSDMVYGAIKGLAQSYNDPYTMFFPPKDAKEFKTSVSGSFEGVGMEVGMKDGLLTVVAPLKGSPSEKAGMLSGDKIIKINGTSTENMTSEVAVSLIRGPKGTDVSLEIFRKSANKFLTINITRDKIDLPVIATENVGDVFIIKLYSFTENSPEKFKGALDEFIKSGKNKLVIDLRNNPGGYLEAAVIMSSFFLDASKNVVSEDYVRLGEKKEHKSRGFNVFNENLKMVILLNKGSASASEIFGGAMQDHKKAKILGETSFGKGSVQEYVELDGGTSIKITVAKWLTPNGNSISDHGVTPDVIVPLTDKKVGNLDNQTAYAVKILNDWNNYQKYSANDKTQLDTTPKSK